MLPCSSTTTTPRVRAARELCATAAKALSDDAIATLTLRGVEVLVRHFVERGRRCHARVERRDADADRAPELFRIDEEACALDELSHLLGRDARSGDLDLGKE